MGTSLKPKLVGLFSPIATFALAVAEATATHSGTTGTREGTVARGLRLLALLAMIAVCGLCVASTVRHDGAVRGRGHATSQPAGAGGSTTSRTVAKQQANLELVRRPGSRFATAALSPATTTLPAARRAEVATADGHRRGQAGARRGTYSMERGPEGCVRRIRSSVESR
jgi:hypothetical protein